MRVFVNRRPVDVVPGMSVKHALVQAGLMERLQEGLTVCDEWGNELGLDGALSEGMKIMVKPKPGGSS